MVGVELVEVPALECVGLDRLLARSLEGSVGVLLLSLPVVVLVVLVDP